MITRDRWRRTAVLVLLGSIAALAPSGPARGADSSVSTLASTGPTAAATGFVLPLPPPPIVLTPFAPPANRYGAGHRGVDLAAQPGAPIVAAGDGVVVFASALAGRGVVSIEHSGGLRTTYEPVTSTVTRGQAVTAGQPIGVLEPSHAGCAPASCLHWGARLPDRVYLDPLSLLAPWRVRLLPWDGRNPTG